MSLVNSSAVKKRLTIKLRGGSKAGRGVGGDPATLHFSAKQRLDDHHVRLYAAPSGSGSESGRIV
jgi:hypothetical protein